MVLYMLSYLRSVPASTSPACCPPAPHPFLLCTSPLQNIKPEARTYNAIISTCNAAGRYAEAVRVHKVMCAAGVEPNGATFNAALTSYARSGQLEAALGLFHAMAVRGYERSANTYAAVLAACDLPGR
jgi:pentatricopeptide repeat protein